MKVNKLTCMIIISLIIFLNGCNKGKPKTINIPEATDIPPTQVEQVQGRTLDKTLVEFKFDEVFRSLNLVDGKGGFASMDGVVHAEEGKDVEILLEYGWVGTPRPAKPVKFNLAVYLDYEQIEFIVDEGKNKTKVHEFYSDSIQANIIPLTIPAEYITATHKLMVTVEYGQEIENLKYYACSFVYDLILGKRTEYNIPLEIDETERIASGGDNVIFINQNMRVLYDQQVSIDYDLTAIRTSPGELVPLAIRFRGKGSKGLLMVSLNGEQVYLEDKKYLFIEHEGDLRFKKTYIKAPEEKGEYVLVGYFVNQPFDIATGEFTLGKVVPTYKMKLVVE